MMADPESTFVEVHVATVEELDGSVAATPSTYLSEVDCSPAVDNDQ